MALHTRPVQDLLEVRLTDGRTGLVPFVEALVPTVDVAAGRVVVDARAAAAVAAIIALVLRAPFIVVVIVAAATAAIIRLF